MPVFLTFLNTRIR